MDVYSNMLKSACETWFKTNYAGIYHSSLRIANTTSIPSRPAGMPKEFPELELKVSIGPWHSVYVWFKSPGVVLSREEKITMNELRNHNCRVAIVRHVEDFKTLVHTLLQPYKQAL